MRQPDWEDEAEPRFKGELSEEEEHEAEERTAVPAQVVHEAIRREGDDELRRSSSALAWSGLAAGMSMGFSLIGQALMRTHLPAAPWRPLVENIGYSLGFVVVVLARQQLFTENTLTGIIPLLARRNAATLLNVLRLWSVVLAANLVGAVLLAWLLSSSNVFGPEVRQAFYDIGREALRAGFGTTLLRAIFAGWMIALMVWMLPVAHTSRLATVVLVPYFIGLGQFPHIIAGSIDVLYLVTAGQVGWSQCLGGYMLPTLIGNVIGGVSLVSVVNHAQVIAGKPRSI